MRREFPNAFGLVGAEANEVEPEKRPLSSMSPTIVLKDGQPLMAVGAAGGPKIITQVLLAILRYIDLEQPISEAVAGPRFHHQWSPDVLLLEESLPTEQVAELVKLGHEIKVSGVVGITQAVAVDPREPGLLQAAHDPRVPGRAMGWSREPAAVESSGKR